MLVSMKVSWKVTRQRFPPEAACASRTSSSVFTLPSTFSQREPGMTSSWVRFVAPFQEIFTSEVTETMRSAHARAPRPGKVPLW